MNTSEPFWMAPRRLRRLLEDGEITATAFSLLAYVGLADRYGDGIVTSRALLADLLDVSTKTVSRSLARLDELDLVASDLRQGVTTFRLRLGEAAKRTTSDSTSDTSSDPHPPHDVRSDLGQGRDGPTRETAQETGLGVFDFGPSRARAETEIEKEKEPALPPFAPRSRERTGWPEGLGERTLGDLLAACSLVESFQTGIDRGTLRAFVVDELVEHDTTHFDWVRDLLNEKRARGGVSTPPEPIRSEAAFARSVLHNLADGDEWRDPGWGERW